MEAEGEFSPAGVAGGVGLDGLCAVVVAGVASEDVDVLAVDDGGCRCSRILH